MILFVLTGATVAVVFAVIAPLAGKALGRAVAWILTPQCRSNPAWRAFLHGWQPQAGMGEGMNGFAMCETCGYAYRPMTCENPACPAASASP